MFLERMMFCQPKLLFLLCIQKGASFPQELKAWDLSDNISCVQRVLLPCLWLWVSLSHLVKITDSLSREQESPFHREGQQIHSSLFSQRTFHHRQPSGRTNFCILMFSVNGWNEDSLGPKEETWNRVSHSCPRRLVLPSTERNQWRSQWYPHSGNSTRNKTCYPWGQ